MRRLITPQNILNQYVELGLLEKGNTNEEFSNLEEASKKLAEILTLSNVRSYFLAALSSDFEESEELNTVSEFVIREWKFFKSTGTNDKPTMLLKAVLLTAIETAMEADKKIAAVLWLSIKNVRRFLKSPSHKDQEIIDKFIEKCRWRYRELSTRDYEMSLGQVEVDFPPLKIPTHWTPATIEDAYEVQSGLEVFTNYLESLDKSTRSAMKKYVSKVADEVNKKMKVIENRSQLIWWKEALYSNYFDCSYRELEQIPMLLAMVVDLTRIVPLYCPVQVEYLLRETLRKIEPTNKDISVKELIELKEQELMYGSRIEDENSSTKGSLLDYILRILSPQHSNPEKDITAYTSIPADASFPLYDLVVWFFNDLQIIKIIGLDDEK